MAKSIFIICNGNSWTEQSKLLDFGGATGNRFGSSVDISGTRAKVGSKAPEGYKGKALFFQYK